MNSSDANMSKPDQCPECGTPLQSGALAGLCPACLLKHGATEDTATSAPVPPFKAPAIADLAPLFPQLEILELIGKGGMGVVYKARQKQLDRIVALKILPSGIGHDTASAERFTREAKALARLNHPGIVTLYEFGVADVREARPTASPADQPSSLPDHLYFFLMEFVDGVTLRQLLHAGRISPREALAIVPQICDALQYAHDQGIVHRDIKPENILLDRRGRVKVADFGLAKLVGVDPLARSSGTPSGATDEARGTSALTDAAKVLGTPNYMAPEQTERPAEVDHRADIYALGVVFYQMLTGELPGRRIEPPSKKVHIDVRLDEVVLRALEKNPDRRYAQASILKTRVETIASGEGQAADSQSLERDRRAGCFGGLVLVGTKGGVRKVQWLNLFTVWLFSLSVVWGVLTALSVVLGKDMVFPPSPGSIASCVIFTFLFAAFHFVRAINEPLHHLVNLDEDRNSPDARVSLPSSPFLSSELNQICAHLTNAERNRASLFALLLGLGAAGTVFGIGWLIQFRRDSRAWILALAAVWGILFVISFPMLLRLQRRFLCSTAWAREQGFTADRLKLFSFKGSASGTGMLVLLALAALVLVALYATRGRNLSPSKTIILTRATNAVVNAESNTRTVTVWTDSTVQPGERFHVVVRKPDGEIKDVPSTLFTQFTDGKTSTSSAFTWFFDGSFTQNEVDAALAQIQKTWIERPVKLAVGKPLELFSVTNRHGGTLTGSIKYLRLQPTPADASTPVKATIRINGRTSSLSLFPFNATVPAGYALRATANAGHAHTMTPSGPNDYHCSWSQPFRMPRPGGGMPQTINNLQARESALTSQLQRLQDQGPIDIFPDKPLLVFSITNGPGDVFEGFLELVGPTASTNNRTAKNSVASGAPDVKPPSQGKTTEEAKPVTADLSPAKTIILARATNALVDASEDVWTVTASAGPVHPGEILRAMVKPPNGELQEATDILYTFVSNGKVNTHSSFIWRFADGFGKAEANAALAQIVNNWNNRPHTLSAGKPAELFSVTNREGKVMAGYINYLQLEPSSPKASMQVKATVRIKNSSLTDFEYSATVPAGYALRASANKRDASTTWIHSPASSNVYRSSWLVPFPLNLSPGPQGAPIRVSPPSPLQIQLRQLKEQGPIDVVLGKPQLLFSTTNEPGNVFQAFLELAGPGDTATNSSTSSASLTVATNGSAMFRTVQAAIDAAPPGATIRIAPGRYDESLVITQSVSLVGAGWEKTVIGPLKPWRAPSAEALKEGTQNVGAVQFFPPVVQVKGAKEFELHGIRFTQPGVSPAGKTLPAAVIEFAHTEAILEDCAVTGSPGNGVSVGQGSSAIILRTLIAAAWNTGIVIRENSVAQVSDSDIRNCHYAGVTIGRNGHAMILGCRISGAAWHGIRYDDVSPLIVNNVIFGNARSGIYASGSTKATISGNVFFANEMNGVSCWFHNRDTIANNTFAGNLREALSLVSRSAPSIRNNIFTGHPVALAQSVTEGDPPDGTTLGRPELNNNLFWENETRWKLRAFTEEELAELDTRNLTADPEFRDAGAHDFVLTPDSPARVAGIGALRPLPTESPWPLQPEEIAIIPNALTRDSRQWKRPDPHSEN